MITMLLLCVAVAVAGCGDRRQGQATSFDVNGGSYQICGHSVRLTPPGRPGAWSARPTADGGAVVNIQLSVLPRRAPDEALAGNIAVLMMCTTSKSDWMTGAALEAPWRHVEHRPELGLTEYRSQVDYPYLRDIAYAADASYLKADGSAFIMECDSNDGIVPIACMVEYELAPGLNISYRYYTDGAPRRWKEVDQLVRATIEIEQSDGDRLHATIEAAVTAE